MSFAVRPPIQRDVAPITIACGDIPPNMARVAFQRDTCSK